METFRWSFGILFSRLVCQLVAGIPWFMMQVHGSGYLNFMKNKMLSVSPLLLVRVAATLFWQFFGIGFSKLSSASLLMQKLASNSFNLSSSGICSFEYMGKAARSKYYPQAPHSARILGHGYEYMTSI